MPDDASLRRPPSRPGSALRKLRTQKGLTLAEVFRRALGIVGNLPGGILYAWGRKES